MMRAVEDRPQVPYGRNLWRRGIVSGVHERWEDPSEIADTIREWVKKQDSESRNSNEVPVAAMPEIVQSALTNVTNQVLDWFYRDISDQLILAYKSSSGLVNRASKANDFRLAMERNRPLLKMVINSTDDNDSTAQFDISHASASSGGIQHWGTDYKLDDAFYPDIYLDFYSHLRIAAADSLFNGLPYRSFILPASRSGIVQGHKILAATIIRQSNLLGAQRVNLPALPGVTTEFLSDLISLDRSMRPTRPDVEFDEAISFIEKKVLHGEIDLDESEGLPYPEISYETSVGKFTLEHSSSMVTELAPVILFLKYLVRPGHLLIFEEPESHLHPAAQLQMARGIARLVNAGVRVLITTHSSDFVGQIDNLISMSNVSEETWASLGLEAEECLQPEQVNAYGFRIDPDKGGAVTYPLPVGSDVGIEDQEFLDVTELLYKQAITLQRNRLT